MYYNFITISTAFLNERSSVDWTWCIRNLVCAPVQRLFCLIFVKNVPTASAYAMCTQNGKRAPSAMICVSVLPLVHRKYQISSQCGSFLRVQNPISEWRILKWDQNGVRCMKTSALIYRFFCYFLSAVTTKIKEYFYARGWNHNNNKGNEVLEARINFFFFEISFLKPFALSLFCAKKNSFFFGGVSQIEITINVFM